jgi:hypothetical protein
MRLAVATSLLAATNAAGNPAKTSSAKLGPENTTNGWSGSNRDARLVSSTALPSSA